MKYREGLHEHQGRPHDLEGHFRAYEFLGLGKHGFRLLFRGDFRVRLMQNLEMTIFDLIQAIEMYGMWLIEALGRGLHWQDFHNPAEPDFLQVGSLGFWLCSRSLS